MVLSESKEKKRIATEALLWLKRALEFTSLGLRLNFHDKQQELSTSSQKAYESTLSPFHNFLIRPIFTVAMKACPKRSEFYQKLQQGLDSLEFEKNFSEWLKALEQLVSILIEFYQTGQHDKGF